MNFDCYYFGVPQSKGKFIKYLATKVKAEQDIKYLTDYYQCTQQTAKEYLKLISEEDMKQIREYFENRGVKK
jgi:cytochrome c553